MNKKTIISLGFVIIFVFALSLLAHTGVVQAQTASKVTPGLLGANFVENVTLLSNSDPRTMASRVINIALGLLAVITVGIILAGGFRWMTAMGDAEKAGDARKMIVAGIIGLGIVLAAWVIATFVLNALINATY